MYLWKPENNVPLNIIITIYELKTGLKQKKKIEIINILLWLIFCNIIFSRF